MVISSLDVPVVGAPMAGGPSTPELVAAVGDAGGLGFLAGAYLTTEALARDIADVWDATSRPFGVNLFVPAHANTYAAGPGQLVGSDRARAVAAYRASLAPLAGRLGVELPEPSGEEPGAWERALDLVVRERVPVVSFTFGLPSKAVLGELRRAGIESVVTVTDVPEATAAIEAGVDALCVQGPEAGGHRGTLDEAKDPGEHELVGLVRSVRALTDLPVVAAGGIADSARAAEVLAAGATAAQIGTALLLTPEAGTGLAYRRALVDPDYAGTTVTRAFSGRWARALETEFVREHSVHAPAAFPEVHHVTAPLRRASAAADDPGLIALWAGTAWRSARAVPAAEVVRSIAGAL
ncbi:nitroalkane oxidase [Intrasporangium oryzae NRRL B-24470]|uniref:Propionate 3-nitronate monooxygenase n=1 Tax=Intrasporangium oryzae NRRL B-24470 TaxID=1386089 RepID=W9GA74_9MICO|nr:nitronate monooxygenase [Intrasporangium oryzae]EWT03066.1 nitroalkane oxidase [Intrasporangium oryzae NRRL B-24470]